MLHAHSERDRRTGTASSTDASQGGVQANAAPPRRDATHRGQAGSLNCALRPPSVLLEQDFPPQENEATRRPPRGALGGARYSPPLRRGRLPPPRPVVSQSRPHAGTDAAPRAAGASPRSVPIPLGSLRLHGGPVPGTLVPTVAPQLPPARPPLAVLIMRLIQQSLPAERGAQPPGITHESEVSRPGPLQSGNALDCCERTFLPGETGAGRSHSPTHATALRVRKRRQDSLLGRPESASPHYRWQAAFFFFFLKERERFLHDHMRKACSQKAPLPSWKHDLGFLPAPAG